MGSIIDLEEPGQRLLRIYLTGDTVPYPGLHEIAQRFTDIDAMMIHLGGTRVAGLLLTMNGEQGAAVAGLIRPALTLPVHYDDYPVFRSPLADFPRALRDRGIETRVQMWGHGDTVLLPYRQAGVRPPAPPERVPAPPRQDQ